MQKGAPKTERPFCFYLVNKLVTYESKKIL